MKRRRKRVCLADRLRPYVDRGPAPEPMVDADPIRMFLYRWMIETGDPIEIVAQGFDIDVPVVAGLLNGSLDRVTRFEFHGLAERLGLAPDTWSAGMAPPRHQPR